MSDLTTYGLMAEKHWRQFRPRMVAELEAEGRLTAALREAERQTFREMTRLTREFTRRNMTPQQAHDQAWELIREKYILLPAEEAPPRD
ncbi:MAG: hypothetical protein KF715_19540 [Candidatus Didemnitutus sp.]|nr:hypothetical protein [Candidatus Didemnitutus sp.]